MKQLFTPLLLCASPFFAKTENLFFPKTQTDTIAPTIFCPPSDTLNLSAGVCQTAYNFNIIATDDSGTPPLVSQISGIPSGQNFPVGTTVQVFRATDLAGNSSSCSFQVVVQHFKIFPVCSNSITVSLHENCTPTNFGAHTPLLNPQIGCPSTYQIHFDKQAPYGNGPWLDPQISNADRNKTYGFRVTDPQHSTQCWGLITFKDNQPPVIACQNLTVSTAIQNLKPEIWRDSAGIIGAVPTVSDNCSPISNFHYVDTYQPLSCTDSLDGRITRRWRATDADGNTGTCTQIISLSHVHFDDVIFPADTLLDCDSENPPTPDFTGRPFVQIGNLRSHNLGKIGATFTDSDTTLCSETQVIQRHWLLVNWCSADVVEYTQIVGTEDKKPPVLICPDQKITLSGTATGCTVQVQLPPIGADDACSPDLQTTVFWSPTDSADATAYSLGYALFDLLPIAAGQQTFSLRTTDDCGNSAFCQFEAQILDGQPPTAACKNLQQIQLGAAGSAQIAAAQLVEVAVDACSPQLSFKARRLLPNCLSANIFSDEINFCCSDVGNIVEITLRVFDFQTPAGAVSPDFGQGQFTDCTARVAVADNQPATCIAPPDLTVTCSEFDVAAPKILTGFSRSCAAADAEFEWDFSQFDSICGKGKVVQTLRVGSAGGQQQVCSRQVFVEFDTAAAMGWAVRFPDDILEKFCLDSSQIGAPEIFGGGCGQVVVSFADQPKPDGFDRRWKIFNRCLLGDDPPTDDFFNVPNFTSTLVGRSLAAAAAPPPFVSTPAEWSQRLGGYFYVQQIRTDNLLGGYFLKNCEPATTTVFPNLMNLHHPQLWHNSAWFDPLSGTNDLKETPVSFSTEIEACDPAAVPTHFILQLDLDNDKIRETILDSRNPPPPGKIMSNGVLLNFDGRPEPTDQKYQFVIKFDSLSDNRRLARLMWSTTAAPTIFLLPHLPQGEHFFEWVVAAPPPATDSKHCSFDFKILPPEPPKFDVRGRLATDQNKGLNAASIQFEPTALPFFPSNNASFNTDTTGVFSFPKSVWQGANFKITPLNNHRPLNGLTTYDLLLISRHILGVQPLTNPYRIIAADVNRSGAVTSNDIVELRKLILGINPTFQSNTSWRFVPKNWAFSNPQNPFAPAFPEIIEQQSAQANFLNQDFVAIKIGDINGNADPDAGQLFAASDERDAPDFHFEIADREFAEGEIFEIKMQPAAPAEAWQWTLETSADLKIETARRANPTAADDGEFFIFEKENLLTAAVFGESAGQNLTLKFRAAATGRLSDHLFLSDRVTRREAVRADGRAARPVLNFLKKENIAAAKTNEPRLLDVAPNPVENLAQLRVVVPDSWAGERLRMVVFDAAGRVILEREFAVAAGLNLLPLDFSEVAAAGVFAGKISAGGFSAVFRLVKI